MKNSKKFFLLFGALIVISVISALGTYGFFIIDDEIQFVNQKNNSYSLAFEDQGLNSASTNNETEKFPCHTFEEWRLFLLNHYNSTFEEMSELNNSSIGFLNEEARIYAGWSNGTYTDEEKSQLLQELHNTPRIAFGVFPFTDISWPQEGGTILTSLLHHTDEKLECVISIQNFILGEQIFRIYAYIDWDISDTDKNYPHILPDYFYGFADGAISKSFPASGDWMNWLGKYPWDTDLDPNEAWMGPDSERIKTIHPQQGWGAQSYTIITKPGRVDNQINFVIQVMWRWDEVVGFARWKPWFKWVTRQTDIYKRGTASKPFDIYDDDIDKPVLISTNYRRVVSELETQLAVTGVVDEDSGFAVYADYYGEVIKGFWVPPSNGFIIWLPTDRIGHHVIPIVFTDLDLDRENDWLASEIEYISYEVRDDDSTSPRLYLSHTGTNTDKNPGYVLFSITEDDRGSEATGTLTIEGPNDFFYSCAYGEGTYMTKLSTIGVLEPGEYTVTLYAENNDEDRGEIDEETSEMAISFMIVDDDIIKPNIREVLYPEVIEDQKDSFTIKVSATDNSGIRWVYASHFGNNYYGIYNATDGLYWINVPSPHSPQNHVFNVVVWDNDNDRDNDQSYNSTSITIKIEDDDKTPPTITSIDIPSQIYDYVDLFFLAFDATDTSGIYKVEVIFTGQVYTIDYSGPNYAFNIPNPKTPGYYQLIIKAWDNDYDSWAGDRSLVFETIWITILDDDDIPPIVTYEYTGDNTDGNPGMIIFTATDASGIEGNKTATYTVPSELGTYDFTFTAVDADNDRLGDSLSTTLIVSITIDDDDKDSPVITYVYTGDFTDGNPGTIIFTATDASGIEGNKTATYTVPSELGTYDFTFTAVDADNDRLGDSLSTTLIVLITIDDDDKDPPVITYVYTGDFTDGNPGTIMFTAADASGIVGDKIVTYTLPSELGSYDYTFTATDADNDRPGDSLTASLNLQITIEDDDISPPAISNLFIQDEIYMIYVSFDVLDDNIGDDEGVSLIIIYIDGEIIVTYDPLDSEVFFEFIIPNDWAMNIGQHNVIIEVWDADDDRVGDSSLSVESGTFVITFEEMKQFVTWEIDQFIIAIQESPDELWGDPIEQRKNAMTNKLIALKELFLSDLFEDAYDKILHDIKPLLTGLKTDENNIDWGNGVYKNAWVVFEDFEIRCNEILSHLQILLA